MIMLSDSSPALSLGQQLAEALRFFVANSKVIHLVSIDEEQRKASEHVGVPPGAPTPLDIEALLLARSSGQVEIDLRGVDLDSSNLPFENSSMTRFFQVYAEFASDSDFRDFEPTPLPLRKGGRRDILQQSRRRQRLCARAYRVKSQRVFKAAMEIIDDRWSRSLDPARPFLVLRSVEEVRKVLAWLVDAGYRTSDILVSMFSVPIEDADSIHAMGVQMVRADRSHRRRPLIGNMPEFAMTSQAVGQFDMPIERDFQRALFALICWHRAEMSALS